MPRRIRTHTNPLKRFPDLDPPRWDQVFRNPELPFALEFGSSKGRFLIEHARTCPRMNILGTEIRRPLVDRLRARIEEDPLGNAWIIYGNVEGRIAEFAPAGRVDAFYLFFPDPWVKKKHHKRRVIRPATLDELASVMPAGASIHIMTDHEELGTDIQEVFRLREDFIEAESTALPARSDWQDYCDETARPYKKMRYVRV